MAMACKLLAFATGLITQTVAVSSESRRCSAGSRDSCEVTYPMDAQDLTGLGEESFVQRASLKSNNQRVSSRAAVNDAEQRVEILSEDEEVKKAEDHQGKAKEDKVLKEQETEFGEEALAKWNAYVAAVEEKYKAVGIQEDCKPRMHAQSSDVAYKGVVVFFHGFTACPQQYFDFAPHLNAKGYVVLLPLLPGHGANYEIVEVKEKKNWWCMWNCEMKVIGHETVDSLDLLPTGDSKGYETFIEEINAVAAAAGGEKLVVGLSLGGALAAQAATKHEYTRSLITVPFFDMPYNSLAQVLRFANFMPYVRDVRSTWGEECELERVEGRGGYCQFQIKHLMTGRDEGRRTGDNLAKPLSNPVQIVLVEGDDAVSNDLVREYAGKLGFGKDPGTQVSSCGYDAAISHSFLSAGDHPFSNKWWINEVTEELVAFLTEGTPVPVEGTMPEGEKNWPRCKLACTAETCTYTPPSGGVVIETADQLVNELSKTSLAQVKRLPTRFPKLLSNKR